MNDEAWEKLFEKYDILNKINNDGAFKISALQIKEFREPRLMAKFDHMINLPEIFRINKLSILPIKRGDYVIAHFNAYHDFETDNTSVKKVALPSYIQSLDIENITSEAVALNCAFATGIMADFLEDEEIMPTVSGRMSSGSFEFTIADSRIGQKRLIEVSNSQIEIDAAYEGINSLSLFEAKRDLSEDFLIRQLYYPFRTWRERVRKNVRTLFLVYSNGIYRLYEYCFVEPNNYNSLILTKQQYYSVEDTEITVSDIMEILKSIVIVDEPNISFPQADSFARIINLCELLNEQDTNRNEITERYDFSMRQTYYYTAAARYLGLVNIKRTRGESPVYSLTDKGKQLLGLNFKKRQLEYCKLILSHKIFNLVLRKYFDRGIIPSKKEIVKIMKDSGLYRMRSNETFDRRSTTISCWINWIVGLING